MWVGVQVDEQLMHETRIIVLRIQFQCLFTDGNLQGCADAIVPGFLLIQIPIYYNLTSTGQQEIVFCQHMIGAIALADAAAQGHNIIGRISQMHSWC